MLHICHDYEQYRSLRNYTKKHIIAAYHNHINDAEEKIRENLQQIWNYVHSLQQESRIPGIMRHNESEIHVPQNTVDTSIVCVKDMQLIKLILPKYQIQCLM